MTTTYSNVYDYWKAALNRFPILDGMEIDDDTLLECPLESCVGKKAKAIIDSGIPCMKACAEIDLDASAKVWAGMVEAIGVCWRG